MIEATITGESAVVARFERLPEHLRRALSDEVRRQWFRIQAAVVTEKLSGDPLHRRTGVLASSINVSGSETVTSFTENAGEIVGTVGTKVKYGKVHEYGGEITIQTHERHVHSRLRGDHTVTVREHKANYPERSFLRSTLSELRTSVIESIDAAVAKAVKEA